MHRFNIAYSYGFAAALVCGTLVEHISAGTGIYAALTAGTLVGVLRYLHPKQPPDMYEE